MTIPTTAQAFTTLIDAPQLAGLLAGSSNTVVLDASFDLADTAAGERRYADAHIAASRYVHLDRDLSTAKTGTNGRHPLPERAAFARTVPRSASARARRWWRSTHRAACMPRGCGGC